MNKQLSPELHLLLAEYFEQFKELRPGEGYPGGISLIEEFEKIQTSNEADKFFSKYGVANEVFTIKDPLERAHAYELLLYILRTHDNRQYSKIHKGTPYYFIAWTLYQTASFERALFYMDAAVSEDLRLPLPNNGGGSIPPALSFFLLREDTQAAGFFTFHINVNKVVVDTLRQFSADSNLNLRKNEFVEKFVEPLLYSDSKHRSILTALYGFFL